MNINVTFSKKKKKNQCYKKKKKNKQEQEILQFFCTNKENKRKNRLIKNKVQIKNVDMRIIKWPQQFYNKFYATSC